ncbi:MAG: AI-2E family transporter [Candidatus Cloacimonetes bacterium]|nr:AI-2E family transporter [Candidatus Cloacimonadota bacterium]
MERSKLIRYILFIFSILLIVAGILFYQFILSYLIVSFIIAYLFSPLVNYAETYQISRSLAIITIYLVIAILLVLVVNLIIPQLIQQAEDFRDTITRLLDENEQIDLHTVGLGKLSQFIDNLEEKLNIEIENTISLRSFISSDKVNKLLVRIPSIFQGVVSLIAFMIVVPVIVFFMLKDERIFIRTLFSSIGNRYFEFSIHLFEKIEESFGKFFRALLLETLLVAVMSIIGLLILGIPNAIILGLIEGLANPIKYFGPFIGAVPTMLVILLGPTPNVYVFYAALMYFIVQQIDSLILFPWMVGKSMRMHPLSVLLTVIAGGYAFGIWGMLFAVPVVFLIKTIVEVSHKSLKEFEII